MATFHKTGSRFFKTISVALVFLHIAIFILPLSLFAAPPLPDELPTGGQVTAGDAAISESGSRMDIDQSTQKAVINWQT
ncbi:MAG: hypothetical protein U9N38_00880, partial [Thermodesulfobacteriota bacterium]|nr:hypothetical protein [Thermodesulfobacteriota bacterium]